MIKAHILVVDDDQRIASLLKRFLMKHGYFVTAASCAREVYSSMALFSFDLIILDVMLPGEDGTKIAQKLKKESNIAIVMLSALGSVENRIDGLESGADDYIAKPFDPKELLLRIENLINRVKYLSNNSGVFYFGIVRYDQNRSILYKRDEVIKLNIGEKKLLDILLQNKNVIVDRYDLAKILQINVRSVDVQITRLRHKIEQNPKNPIFLQTARGKGYIIYVN